MKGMCYAAPGIINLLDRMGVPFNRTREGLLDFRRFGGTLHHRTAFAGATTGQQLLYALDEQVRRYEAEGKVTKYEGWEFLGWRGTPTALPRRDRHEPETMEIEAFPAEAVSSRRAVRASSSADHQLGDQHRHRRRQRLHHGAIYGNPEFIQVHPTAIPGEDKLRLMSEIGARRGRPGLGAQGQGRTPAIPKTSRSPSAGTSLRRSTPASRTWCRATWPAARSSTVCRGPGDGRGRRLTPSTSM